jgi:2-dehydropantoate 2-reductase
VLSVRVAIVGVGGVGGYFGGRLAAAGEEVHLVARGVHLDAIRQHGLRVKSVGGEFDVRIHATDDTAQIGPVDHVLFCVKSYDTASAAPALRPLLHEETAVVSLQNGIDNEDVLADVIGRDHVVGGVAFIFSTIAEPGVIAQTGGPRRIVFGELDSSMSARMQDLEKSCRKAGIDAQATQEIHRLLWDKLALICAHAGVTSTIRLPIGEIREVPEAMAMFRRISEEVRAVAAAEGVDIGDDAIGRHEAFVRSLEPGVFSSLHEDLVHGRRMELEGLHGSVVRRARKHGISVPACESVYGILRPWAVRNEAASAG